MTGGRPRISVERELRAFGALARGTRRPEAAAFAGVSLSTLKRRLSEEAVPVLRDRRVRPGALSLEERQEIRVGIERKETDSEIARRLGRHRGSIGREIHANGGRVAYRAYQSHDRADWAARRPRPPWNEHRAWLWAEARRACAQRSGRLSRSRRRYDVSILTSQSGGCPTRRSTRPSTSRPSRPCAKTSLPACARGAPGAGLRAATPQAGASLSAWSTSPSARPRPPTAPCLGTGRGI
jgi:Helix-turn-helix domain